MSTLSIQPLAAFSCGVDTIKEIVADFETHTAEHQSHHADSKLLHGAVQAINKTLDGLSASYHMLIMTINRCTDYTKACHNIDLVPSLEIMTLQQTISDILTAVDSLFGANKVSLQYIDPRLCTHIITDRQWLQDNLLCLCSNAVKFSTVRVAHLSLKIQRASDRQESDLNVIHANAISGYELLRFEVRNFGEPVSIEMIEQMFLAPKFQAQRSVGGSGLGLYCLGKRLAALGGNYGVELHHELGDRGTTFWFAIPYKPSKTRSSGNSASASTLPSSKKVGFSQASNQQSLSLHSGSLQRRASAASGDERSETSGAVIPISKSSELIEEKPTDVSSEQQPPLLHALFKTGEVIEEEPLNVLIVDDSQAILKMLRMMLEKHGHSVTTAMDGSEGVTKVFDCSSEERQSDKSGTSSSQSGKVSTPSRHAGGKKIWEGRDLILMDLQMPVMDGFEAIRTIRVREQEMMNSRRNSPYPLRVPNETAESNEAEHGGDLELRIRSAHQSSDMPFGGDGGDAYEGRHLIIAMSASSDHTSVSDAYAAGADYFLPKPFKLDSLQSLLHEHKKRWSRSRSRSRSESLAASESCNEYNDAIKDVNDAPGDNSIDLSNIQRSDK